MGVFALRNEEGCLSGDHFLNRVLLAIGAGEIHNVRGDLLLLRMRQVNIENRASLVSNNRLPGDLIWPTRPLPDGQLVGGGVGQRSDASRQQADPRAIRPGPSFV